MCCIPKGIFDSDFCILGVNNFKPCKQSTTQCLNGWAYLVDFQIPFIHHVIVMQLLDCQWEHWLGAGALKLMGWKNNVDKTNWVS